MKHDFTQPIGIFDSGVGGLTVAHAIHQLMPNENIVYFGDTAHVPYGDRSAAAIQAYCIKVCDMLLKQNCKLIFIACNTASAAAFELIKEYIASKSNVLNVIDPMVNYLREHYAHARVGLIATRFTVLSNVYKRKVDVLNKEIDFESLATPLLVPMIEEGIYAGPMMEELIHDYLSRPELANIRALILGCTHYPLIKPVIQKFYKNRVDILDSALMSAEAVQHFLAYHHLENQKAKSSLHFYVSDYTESFARSAKLFFQGDITLEHYPLWE
jgi:glutamate racemase